MKDLECIHVGRMCARTTIVGGAKEIKRRGGTKASYRKLHLFNFSLPRVRPQEARMIRDSTPSCSSQDPSALANLPAPGPVEERHSTTQTNKQ